MKKLIPLFILALCLAGCGETVKVENPDTLKAAVISAADSVTAKNTYNALNESTVATLTAERLDVSQTSNLSDYDVLYIDKSVTETPDFDAAAVQEYVSNGGSVFLDNEVYGVFDSDFIGALEFVALDACPLDMSYEEGADSDAVRKIQELISDFCGVYKNYANYEETLSKQSYGVGVVPSTAQCIASENGVGIYTLNQYGDGYVFFTNPLLPNAFSVNNLSPDDEGEYLAASTVGANKLMRDYFAEFVSLQKYGYAVEHIFGSFARPAAAWELYCEDMTGIENGSAVTFAEMCTKYGQVPSFSLARNQYIWLSRAESVTYALSNNGAFAMDPYENAYSSGTHFVSDKEWLSLDYYDNTISYFEDSYDYIKRAYPCPTDYNVDGNMDLICGSADGNLYFYSGIGMGTNYEFNAAALFTDSDGTPVSVGAFSSPALADLNIDGIAEIISGSEDGKIYFFKPLGGLVLENQGVILETGLTDAMPSVGDLNGDGIADLAVGSRNGELRIYYGHMENYGVAFGEYETIDSGQSWCAPCIADADNDGVNELYAGTFEGYIVKYENNILSGYLEGNECNYLGNIHLKFGSNCVPRFYDIDNDGNKDLIVGSLEYGMAVPIDSEYFPYQEELLRQVNYFKDKGIYIGAHTLSHEHADMFHDQRELEYHKNAFTAYGLDFVGGGANQHMWYTSKIGYDTHYDNTRGYDGTYRAQFEAGLYWNSGSHTPDSMAEPAAGAENVILVPFYLDNGQLMLQPSNSPAGNSAYAQLSAKYEVPLFVRESY